jgi:hypothetical protein
MRLLRDAAIAADDAFKFNLSTFDIALCDKIFIGAVILWGENYLLNTAEYYNNQCVCLNNNTLTIGGKEYQFMRIGSKSDKSDTFKWHKNLWQTQKGLFLQTNYHVSERFIDCIFSAIVCLQKKYNYFIPILVAMLNPGTHLIIYNSNNVFDVDDSRRAEYGKKFLLINMDDDDKDYDINE